MASTDRHSDERMEAHRAGLSAKRFEFGRGEPKPKEPSAEDLDAVAAEEKAKAATSKPKRVIVAKG